MCTGRFLFMYEERMPPGAASGGQQGPQRAAASMGAHGSALQSAGSGVRFSHRISLWCTPGGAGGRDLVVRA